MAFEFLKFGADWCGPCKTLQPKLDILESEFGDKVTFTKIDADSEQNLVQKYSVKALPTVILLKDDEEIFRSVGAVLLPALRTQLRKAIKDD